MATHINALNYNQTPIQTTFRIKKEDIGYWTTMFNDFVDAYIDDAKVTLIHFTDEAIFIHKDGFKTRFNQYSTFTSKEEVLGYVKGLIDAKNIADRKAKQK